jgi:hypothetical protein
VSNGSSGGRATKRCREECRREQRVREKWRGRGVGPRAVGVRPGWCLPLAGDPIRAVPASQDCIGGSLRLVLCGRLGVAGWAKCVDRSNCAGGRSRTGGTGAKPILLSSSSRRTILLQDSGNSGLSAHPLVRLETRSHGSSPGFPLLPDLPAAPGAADGRAAQCGTDRVVLSGRSRSVFPGRFADDAQLRPGL